jgi:hypothetical protein
VPLVPLLSGPCGAAKMPRERRGKQSVDYHLERGLRLHTRPKHERLYTWAINEIDAQGKQIGED